jgi:NADH-quinone oxidoreductase subunit C
MSEQTQLPGAAIGPVEQLAGQFTEALTVSCIGEDVAGTVGVLVPWDRWHDALAYARDGLALDFFDWLSAVDQTDGDPAGFDVIVHLVQSRSGGPGSSGNAVSVGEGSGLVRMLVRTRVPEDTALASVTDLWPGAAWHERETFEMFGLAFSGFADGTGLGLRPLLLPEGFEGTPLRKSFVLAARASKPWPGAKEPGESDAHGGSGSPSRRKLLPPGVPDSTWGPRSPGQASDE